MTFLDGLIPHFKKGLALLYNYPDHSITVLWSKTTTSCPWRRLSRNAAWQWRQDIFFDDNVCKLDTDSLIHRDTLLKRYWLLRKLRNLRPDHYIQLCNQGSLL